MLWLRNNISTWGSQFFDTIIFYSIGFYGVIPNSVLSKVIIGSYLLKLLVALFDTPIVYLVVYWIKGNKIKNRPVFRSNFPDLVWIVITKSYDVTLESRLLQI